MRIAVTGATGFVGRALCARLGAEHELRALVRAPDTTLRCEQRVIGDLARFREWRAALDGMQAVVHLAGYAHGHGDAASLHAVNIDATLAAAQAARSAGAHFIFASTIKVHGDESRSPLKETSPLAPRDPYARSKAQAEEALRSLPGLRLTVLRAPLVYGPGVKANFLALMRAVDRGWPLPLASVGNRRSLIYVGNLADAIIRCLGHEGTYLVSDGGPISTTQLCRELAAALGRPARLFPCPPSFLPRKLAASLEVDDSAIRGSLGWQPPHSREAGLRATAEWYLAGR
ncbi:MAG: NAD-dependent epimerase/dehydratase family protein [Burkholderiales bacterium]